MGRRTDLSVIAHRRLTASRMSGSGPKILILVEPTRFPAFARLGGWFMAPSRAAAYPPHAQECLRLADLMTLVSMAQEQHRCTAGGQAALVPPQDSVLHHHSWIGHGSALP